MMIFEIPPKFGKGKKRRFHTRQKEKKRKEDSISALW